MIVQLTNTGGTSSVNSTENNIEIAIPGGTRHYRNTVGGNETNLIFQVESVTTLKVARPNGVPLMQVGVANTVVLKLKPPATNYPQIYKPVASSGMFFQVHYTEEC